MRLREPTVQMGLGRFEKRGARARTGDFLLVAAGDFRARIPTGTLLEIMDPRPLTALPESPEQVLGILNYRGSPATVVDLARAVGMGEVSSPSRLVLLRWGGFDIALAVGDVLSLADAADADGQAPVVDLDVLFRSIF